MRQYFRNKPDHSIAKQIFIETYHLFSNENINIVKNNLNTYFHFNVKQVDRERYKIF